jgi:hypothetical protein
MKSVLEDVGLMDSGRMPVIESGGGREFSKGGLVNDNTLVKGEEDKKGE